MRSDLPAGCRHVCHVLCVYIDAKAGVILPMFTPSLTQLARDTGLSRRTIMRHLAVAERKGWVIRKRPPPAKARKEHARTRYTIRIPDLGTAGLLASDIKSPELGTQDPEARDTMTHDSSRSSWSSDAEVIETIIDAIRQVSGTTVSADWAERVADQVLGARDTTIARNPAAFARSAILKAPPTVYKPTPQPPRFTATGGFTK
jgi:DNA-binding transcriptional ArsR family regulator